MRKQLATISMFTALALGLFARTAGAVPFVYLVGPGSVSPGASFQIEVRADGIEAEDELIAFGFDVSSDAGVAFDAAAVGAAFADDSILFPTTLVAGSVFPGVSGDGILLATLDFVAGLSPGSFAIAVGTSEDDFGMSEGLFTLLDVAPLAAGTTVTVVPEPGTACLLAFGVAALARARRRRALSAP